jgi:glyoxylase-like metal-dependent hydrolase (beta-lactamase superfamily II)
MNANPGAESNGGTRMFKKWMIAGAAAAVLLAGVLAWAKGTTTDVKAAVSNSLKALGADNLKTIEYSGSGADFSVGQAQNPKSQWPRFNDKTYTRQIDFNAPASRMQRVRTQGENPPRGGGGQPLVGEQAQNQVVTNATQLNNELTTMLPYSFLRTAASAPDATAKVTQIKGKAYTEISFLGPNKAMINGYINTQGMIEKIETTIDNNVLGDTPFVTTFTDYKDFNGLKFPTHIVQKTGDWSSFELMITDVKPNAAVTIENPQAKGKGKGGPAGGAAGPGAGVAAAEPPTEDLGGGMYLILGGYASVAADFKDGIVIVEGPQNDQRAQQIIATAKKLIPNKPIKYVINTHNHFDHCGGLRAFVAEGATIVTQEINKPYYEKIWKNPHTLTPDVLSKTPKKPAFLTVKEKRVMTDGEHNIEIYRVEGSIHNDGMLMVYLPKQKIVIEADEFNPPAPNQPVTNPSPYWQNLYSDLDRLKLDYDRIIPIHYPADNRKVMKAELLRAIGQGS